LLSDGQAHTRARLQPCIVEQVVQEKRKIEELTRQQFKILNGSAISQ